MISGAAASAASETSCSATSKPASAKTWAMPLPICPAPITPTRLISIDFPPRPPRRVTIGSASGGVQWASCRLFAAMRQELVYTMVNAA